ncbi:MAG: NAD(P)/FAD-dependent oxidoreductase [Terriglobia bacterium]
MTYDAENRMVTSMEVGTTTYTYSPCLFFLTHALRIVRVRWVLLYLTRPINSIQVCMQKTDSSSVQYDVIVIGSGASGGMAAWNLTRQGAKVLMLDAGERFKRADYWTHVWPDEAREREQRGLHPPEFPLSQREQPYLTPSTASRPDARLGT